MCEKDFIVMNSYSNPTCWRTSQNSLWNLPPGWGRNGHSIIQPLAAHVTTYSSSLVVLRRFKNNPQCLHWPWKKLFEIFLRKWCNFKHNELVQWLTGETDKLITKKLVGNIWRLEKIHRWQVFGLTYAIFALQYLKIMFQLHCSILHKIDLFAWGLKLMLRATKYRPCFVFDIT